MKELPMLPAAIAVAVSDNSKLGKGKIAATMASQASCPTSCEHYGTTCYANRGRPNLTTSRLNKSPEIRAHAIAQEEADAIDKLKGNLPLRLHVVGDAKTSFAVKLLAAAAMRYIEKFGQIVWTYSHCWRWIKRKHWQNVSVIASCKDESDIPIAHAMGYASAYVVDKFKQNTAYKLDNGFTLIPCPEQTKGRTCVQCQMCWKDKSLHERKMVIGFQKH